MALVRVILSERSVTYGLKEGNKFKPKYSDCSSVWTVGLDSRSQSGLYKTGLTKEEEARFEEELQLEKGELSKSSDYWANYKIKIPEEGLVINTDDHASEELAYKVLKADTKIATSLEEAKRMPNVEFILTSDVDEAVDANTRRNVVQQAWVKFAKLTQAEITTSLYMLGLTVNENSSPEINRSKLGDIVENEPAKFLKIIGDPMLKDKVKFIKFIKEGVLQKKGVSIGYDRVPIYFRDILLGNGLEEAIKFCKDKEHQSVMIGIEKEMKEMK